jgi:hypothetical protein
MQGTNKWTFSGDFYFYNIISDTSKQELWFEIFQENDETFLIEPNLDIALDK